jgi:hypothetical protein
VPVEEQHDVSKQEKESDKNGEESNPIFLSSNTHLNIEVIAEKTEEIKL